MTSNLQLQLFPNQYRFAPHFEGCKAGVTAGTWRGRGALAGFGNQTGLSPLLLEQAACVRRDFLMDSGAASEDEVVGAK